MKKILIVAIASIAMISLANCASIDTTKVGGKTVVTATQLKPVIVLQWGAPVTACLDDLNANGVSEVTNAGGPPTKGLFMISRISSSEYCQATGTK